jgi:hypothetical protein
MKSSIRNVTWNYTNPHEHSMVPTTKLLSGHELTRGKPTCGEVSTTGVQCMFASAPSATPSLGRCHTRSPLLGRPAARPLGKKGLHREGVGPLLLCFGNRLHQIGEGAAAPGRSGNRRAWVNTVTHASIRGEWGSLRLMLRSARGEWNERVASGLSLPPCALETAGAAVARDLARGAAVRKQDARCSGD